MKNILFIFLIILYSCGSNPEKHSDTEEEVIYSEDLVLHGNYLVKQIGSRNLNSEGVILVFDQLKNEVSGNAGCNRFSSGFVLSGGAKVSFQQPVSTKMYCEGKMETEKALISSIEQVSEVKQQEGNLIFYSENNELLLVIEKQD